MGIFIPGINICKMKPIITWPFHQTALSFDDLNLMVSILLFLITEASSQGRKRTSNIAGFPPFCLVAMHGALPPPLRMPKHWPDYLPVHGITWVHFITSYDEINLDWNIGKQRRRRRRRKSKEEEEEEEEEELKEIKRKIACLKCTCGLHHLWLVLCNDIHFLLFTLYIYIYIYREREREREDTLFKKKHGDIAVWRLPGAFFHLWLSGTIKYFTKKTQQQQKTQHGTAFGLINAGLTSMNGHIDIPLAGEGASRVMTKPRKPRLTCRT